MTNKRFRLEGMYPYVDESLAALELAYRDGDIRQVKAALSNKLLKHASIKTRSRATAVIVQRFLPYDRKTFRLTRTPWLEFVNTSFSRDAKIKVLWYAYALANPLYQAVLERLNKDGREVFSRTRLGEIASSLFGRDVKDKPLHMVAVSLRDFGFVRFEKEKRQPLYHLVSNALPFPAFAFVLYQHFLDQGTIVPKMSEVKEFFRNWYNQPEEETERLARAAPQGFWVIERMAHLDQLALICTSMDEVLKRLVETTNANAGRALQTPD